MIMDLASTLFGIMASAYALAIIIPLALRNNYTLSIRAGLSFVFIASLSQLILSSMIMIRGSSACLYGYFCIDSFSALFLAIIGLAGLSISLYGMEYMELYKGLGGAWAYSLMVSLFLSSMAMLCISDNLLLFLFFWEVMTLTSIILIGWEYGKKQVVRATKQYLYTMLLLNSFPLILGVSMLWAGYGTLQLSSLEKIISTRSPAWLLSIIMFYIAFTAKAGLYPLHFWLPDAHPAAPSNISSLLSGVMIKMGVYGLFGVMLRYLHPPVILYYLLLVQALLSIFWGSIKAVGENHAKRLLAYSSVSQIGYILVPLSLSAITLGFDRVLSALLLAAGLAYLFAHSIFKTLLFLTSGCYIYVYGSAGLDDVANIGAVSRTAMISIVVGSLSLAGLPPLLGYIAKLSIYASILRGASPLYSVITAMVIALSPLTLLYSVKYMAPALRLVEKKVVRGKIGYPMRAGMLVPVVLLVVFGLYSIFGLFTSISMRFYGVAGNASVEAGLIHIISPYGYYFPLIVFASIGLGLLLGYIDRGKDVVTSRVWTTGYIIPPDKHLIRPSHLYIEFSRIFEPLTGFSHEVYECLVWRIPSKIVYSGIASRITRFFGGLNTWFAAKARGLAEKYSGIREFKLDELAGSSVVAAVRVFGNMARLIIVSPIALFTIALLILSVIILVILLFWWV